MSRVLSEMLTYLADHTHAYPGCGEFDTPEKWDAHLRDLAVRFAALNDDGKWGEDEAHTRVQSAWKDFAENFGYYWD